MSKLMLKKATVLAVLEALKAAQTEIKTQETSKVAAARSEARAIRNSLALQRISRT